MDGANMNAQVCFYAHLCILSKYLQSCYHARLGTRQTSGFVVVYYHFGLQFNILSNFQNEVSYEVVFGNLVRVYRWDLQALVGLEQMFAI